MESSAFNCYFFKVWAVWLPVEVCRLHIDGHKPRQEEKCGLLAAGEWTLNQQAKQYRFIKLGFFFSLEDTGTLNPSLQVH